MANKNEKKRPIIKKEASTGPIKGKEIIPESVETLEVEEVAEDQKPTPKQEVTKKADLSTVAFMSKDKGLSADARITALNLIKSEYLSTDDKSTQLYASFKSYFDIGMAFTIVNDLEFIKEEGKLAGLSIDIDQLSGLQDSFKALGVNINKSALPPTTTNSTQQEIPFNAIQVSEETKTEVKKERNVEVPLTDLTQILSKSEDEQKDLIEKMLVYHLSQKNGIGGNLQNALGAIREIVRLRESDKAKQKSLDKLPFGDFLPDLFQAISRPPMLISGLARNLYGQTHNDKNPIAAHCILKRYCPNWTDTDISSAVLAFSSIGNDLRATESKKAVDVDSDFSGFVTLSDEEIQKILQKESPIDKKLFGMFVGSFKEELPKEDDKKFELEFKKNLTRILNLYVNPQERLKKYIERGYSKQTPEIEIPVETPDPSTSETATDSEKKNQALA